MPHEWSKQAQLRVFDFHIYSNNSNNVFGCIDISESICEGVVEKLPKNPTEWADSTRAGLRRKQRGEYDLSNEILNEGRHDGKGKIITKIKPNGKLMDKQCMIFGGARSYEECKVMLYFDIKWSITCKLKYCQLGKSN